MNNLLPFDLTIRLRVRFKSGLWLGRNILGTIVCRRSV